MSRLLFLLLLGRRKKTGKNFSYYEMSYRDTEKDIRMSDRMTDHIYDLTIG